MKPRSGGAELPMDDLFRCSFAAARLPLAERL